MKAEEIRKKDLIHHLGHDAEHLPVSTMGAGPSILDCAYFLQEIAAQFADLNERLDGFMGSMVQLAKGIAELNMELRESDRIDKWIDSLRICGAKDKWEKGYDRAVTDIKREFLELFARKAKS